MAETHEDSRPDKVAPEPGTDLRADHKATRQRTFLEHLAITSSIKESAAVAGIANSTLYLWRDTDPDFAAAWLKALAEGYALLEMEMLERARKGVERKIYYHGKHVGTVRDYDHKTALQLLRLNKETVALVRAAHAEQTAEEEPAEDRLEERLKKINVRLRAFRAEQRRRKAAEQDPDHRERNGAVHGE